MTSLYAVSPSLEAALLGAVFGFAFMIASYGAIRLIGDKS